MAWHDDLRTKNIKRDYFNSYQDALAAKKAEIRKTRITKYVDYKDSKGICYYKYVLNIYSI